MKLDFSPLMMKVARDLDMSPGEVHKALERVAPGNISRRAVGYWFADPSDASFRRCDPRWVSLLLMSLHVDRKMSRFQVKEYLNLMQSIVDFAAFQGKPKSRKSPSQAMPSDQMFLLQRVLDRSERGRSARGFGPNSDSRFPFNPEDATSSVPGI